MPAQTPSYAKNTIRRTLRAIVDPEPSKKMVNDIWAHFQSQCAHCGVLIERSSRTGQIDHLVSQSDGGSNHLSNRVLSCR